MIWTDVLLQSTCQSWRCRLPWDDIPSFKVIMTESLNDEKPFKMGLPSSWFVGDAMASVICDPKLMNSLARNAKKPCMVQDGISILSNTQVPWNPWRSNLWQRAQKYHEKHSQTPKKTMRSILWPIFFPVHFREFSWILALAELLVSKFQNGSQVRCWFIWFVGCFQKIWASGSPLS